MSIMANSPSSIAVAAAPSGTRVAIPLRCSASRSAMRDDRQCRVGLAGGGKDRASGNIQIVDTEHLAIPVDNAGCSAGAHAGRADVMAAIGAVPPHNRFNIRFVRASVRLADRLFRQIVAQQIEDLGDAFHVLAAVAPVDPHLAIAKAVLRSCQANPAVRIGHLFGMEIQAEQIGPRADNDRWKFPFGQRPVAQPVTQEPHRGERIGRPRSAHAAAMWQRSAAYR